MNEPEKIICNLFKYPAPIVFIIGRYDFGKTDFSLRISETLLKNNVVHKVGTNIKVKDNPSFHYITNVPRLKRWLGQDRSKKLFILDEAGIHVDTRNPMGRINREIRHLGFIIRKFRGKLIFVSQRAKDIETTFRDTDIWLATFRKLSKKRALLYSNVHVVPIVIEDIPRTTIKYDTYDVALFGSEATDFEPETQEQAMVKAWLDSANFRKVARQFNIPHTAQAKRIIVNELKSMLGSVLKK